MRRARRPPLAAQTAWPTKGWPTATPQAVGLNAKVLDSLDAEIASGRYGNVDRMLVIRHGRVAFDKTYAHDYDRVYADSVHVTGALNPHDETGPYNYYNPWWHPYYRRGDLHTLQSVTKTIASVIIGVAVTRGDFPSLDTPVLSFFDAAKVANVDDRKRRMTIRHLLTMTAGLDWNESLPYADPRNTADGTGGERRLGEVHDRSPDVGGSGHAMELQQRRVGAARVHLPQGDEDGHRGIRRAQPVRAARHRALVLEAHADRGSPTPKAVSISRRATSRRSGICS